MWSLAVEEQFYLLWPPFLWCLYRLLGVRQKTKPVLLWVGGLIVLSFMGYAFFQETHAKLVFYMMPFRLWELGIGAFLARMMMDKRLSQTAMALFEKPLFGFDLFAPLMFWGSFLFLLVSLFFLGTATPGFPTLSAVPVFSAGILLVFTGKDARKHGVKQVLSFSFLVKLGRISYPLYLFHWPFICFYKMVQGATISLVGGGVIFGAATLLSYGVYVWVESPIRRRPTGLWVWALVGIFMAVGAAGWLVYKEAIPSWVSVKIPQMKAIEGAMKDWDYPSKNAKKINYLGETFYQIGKKMPTIMVVGDSTAEQYGPRIDRLVSFAPGTPTVMMATWGGGFPLPGVGRDKRERAFFGKVFDFIEKNKIKTVVLSAQWLGYLSGNCQHFYKKAGFLKAVY
ncbi:MAG: acyltransferase [Holosporaceae bacterium]|nr:MAG: acyltransferase [Holosporaceae bacterium]